MKKRFERDNGIRLIKERVRGSRGTQGKKL